MKKAWLQKISSIIFLFFTVVVLNIVCISNVYATNVVLDKKLEEINNLQREYFKIIKRNDVLLLILSDKNNKILKEDDNDLNKLYRKMEKLIGKDNKYLKEYKNLSLEKHEKNNANDFYSATKFYDKEVQNYLITILKLIKSTVSVEDFRKIFNNQTNWLDEMEQYEKLKFKHDGIIAEINNEYCQIDMIKFRTLLLILYLTEAEKTVKEIDFGAYIKDLHNGKTSLGEDVKVSIMLSPKDLKYKFIKDLKYKEVVTKKIDFYSDGLKLNNSLVMPETAISVSEILGVERINDNETLFFIPALLDVSWQNKGLKIGSVLRPQNINTGKIQDKGIRYYIVGYLKNASKDGLYIITDVDVDSMIFYGSCGRGCHYDSFEQIEYKSK